MSKRSMRAGAGADLAALAAQGYWREDAARTALEALGQSGLSLPEFARRHGLGPARLRRWQRQLGGATSASRAMEFLPVHVIETEPVELPATPAGATSMEIVLAGNRRVRVEPGFDGASLARLVRLLEESPC